jgi:nitronate monooxygenase
MVREHPGAPAAYPEINNATRALRARAARAGDPEHMSLYAGTAFGRARAEPAAAVVERLVSRVRR